MKSENHVRREIRTTLLFLASLAVWIFALTLADAAIVTFTNDMFIAATDLTYDGLDIVVQACTVTADGGHTFNSVLLTNTATLSLAGGVNLNVSGDLWLTTTSTLICRGTNTSAQVASQWVGAAVT